MKSFTLERIGPKTILGLALLALSFVIYTIFQSTDKTYLIPIGAASFGIGFHLSLSKIKALQSIKKVLTFIVIGTLVFGIVLMDGWDKTILNSSYTWVLTGLITKFAVFLLNLFNIHATQSGTSIIFPPESKISQVDVLPACAGLLEYAIFVAAFGLMLIDLGRKASKKKLATVFVLGATSVFFANMVRILFLVYVGYTFGYNALETDHMYAGFMIFLSLIGVFWWLSIDGFSKSQRRK